MNIEKRLEALEYAVIELCKTIDTKKDNRHILEMTYDIIRSGDEIKSKIEFEKQNTG